LARRAAHDVGAGDTGPLELRFDSRKINEIESDGHVGMLAYQLLMIWPEGKRGHAGSPEQEGRARQ